MKHCFSRAMWVLATVTTLFLLQTVSLGQSGKWDPGVPSNLFNDGKTEGKNPQPTHRLAPTTCDDCQSIVTQLQAALDDWYVMQLADGKDQKIDYSDTSTAGSEKQRAKKKQMDDAMSGLGQPNTKDLDAKQKQQKKDAKDKKDTHGNKDALAKEIKRLSDALTECLKKCAPAENAPGVTEGGGATPTPTPESGEPPATGGKAGGAAVKPLPTLPALPDCWKTSDDKKKFLEDLDTAEKELLSQRAYYQPHGGFNGNEEDRLPAAQAVNKALNKINDLREAAEGVKPCPHGMAPRQRTGEYFASLINDGAIKVETVGTGETIGHVADFVVQNLTDGPVNCAIPPVVLESGSRKNQDYVCPRGQDVALQAHETKTVPMNGVCINRHKPPVGKGIGGDLVANDGGNLQDRAHSHLNSKDADKLLRLCTAKYDAVDKLQKDGALKDLPYRDAEKQKDICVQWSTWSDPRISEIVGGPPATKEDLKKVVYKQFQEQGSVSPDKKKKIDQGIDTIFDKIELTNEKAKDLEKPEEGGGETEEGYTPPTQPEYVGQTGHTYAKQPTPTATPKPKGGGGKTKTKPTPTPTPTSTPTPTATPSGGPTTQEKPKEEPTPEEEETPLPKASYPYSRETDCGTITISIGPSGELIFDFKSNNRCPCKKYGWIQHFSNADNNAWYYDNGTGEKGSEKTGAKSNPDNPNQPTTPPKGKKEWPENPWYGGTTDPNAPKDFDKNPKPQDHISDTPSHPNTKFRTQLVCVDTGEVLFTWAWGPVRTGKEELDKVGGAEVPPPSPKK